jgi:hypothetical protein
MTVQGFTDQGETGTDNLLAGEFPRVSVLATITGGQFTHGTVLQVSDSGTYTICTDTPEAVLAEDVDASEDTKQAVIYLTGEFNKAALKATSAIDDTLIAKLRTKSIFVKANQAY